MYIYMYIYVFVYLYIHIYIYILLSIVYIFFFYLYISYLCNTITQHPKFDRDNSRLSNFEFWILLAISIHKYFNLFTYVFIFISYPYRLTSLIFSLWSLKNQKHRPEKRPKGSFQDPRCPSQINHKSIISTRNNKKHIFGVSNIST